MKDAVVLLILAVCTFTGCLTIPGSPTARLIRKDAVELDFSMPHSVYETTSYPHNPAPMNGAYFINGDTRNVDYDSPIFSLRNRFNLDNLEIGAGLLGVIYADIKYSPFPQNSLFLPALDTAVYLDISSSNPGVGEGIILNIQPLQNFSFVSAAYLQYMAGSMNKFLNVEKSDNTDQFYGFIPGMNSYLYCGVEWDLSDNIVLHLGTGYLILVKNDTTFTSIGETHPYHISNAFIVNYGIKLLI